MNRYDSYITEYLTANKEVTLEKIGTIKMLSDHPDPETMVASISFNYDRKAFTSPGLIDFITEKSGKLRTLIESDLESHFTQVREFLNIGKTYEVLNAGIIKPNNKGEYEFVLSQTGRIQKVHSQPVKSSGRRNSRSALQVFTLLIVIAIVGGLCWEAYQFYIKPKTHQPLQNMNNTNEKTDSIAITTAHNDSSAASPVTYTVNDTVNVRYIFETTYLLLRAKSRTAQLQNFGNTAGYDSLINDKGKLYLLFIYKKTRIGDTLAVKDSLQKFLQKDIQIRIAPQQ